jgi:putative MATE family efflux protein
MQKSLSINRISTIFSFIKKAIQGETLDYTTISIRKAVFMLAIPMILEMMLESVFALVDLYFVGHLPEGRQALQTVGLTESVLTIIYSVAIGISMAATALVARRIGEKDPDGAAKAAMQTIYFSLIVTVALSVPGFYFAGDILRIMGAEPETIRVGSAYTRIMMGGSVVIMLLFLINGIFRGAGDASMAMKSLWLANICNIVLCPILIRGLGPIPAFGLTGAAIATTTGRSIGVIYQVYHMFNGAGTIKLLKRHLQFDWAVIKSVITIASPGTFQFIIASCSWIFLAKLVADTGHDEASAGYQTALRIIMFFILPAWGLSNAAATLVGQNLGAKQPERAERSVIQTAKYSVIFMATVTFIFFVFTGPLVSFFTTDAEVKRFATQAMRIISSGYIFYGIAMVMTNAFNGAGDTWTPTWINLAGFWFFQIPLAWFLATRMDMGTTGVFIAIPVAETAITIAAYLFFKKGDWKKKMI